MGKTAKQATMVTDANGVQHRFAAGDEVPDELVERIDNPAVWEEPEGDASVGPDPTQLNATATVSTRPEISPGVHDAPYATPADESVEGVVNQAGTGLENDETLTTDRDSDSSASPEQAGVKPSSDRLDGMTKAELEDVAWELGVAVPSGASKSQVRAIIDSAPDRPAADRP